MNPPSLKLEPKVESLTHYVLRHVLRPHTILLQLCCEQLLDRIHWHLTSPLWKSFSVSPYTALVSEVSQKQLKIKAYFAAWPFVMAR